MLIRKFRREDIGSLRKVLSVSFGMTSSRSDEQELEWAMEDQSLIGRSYFNRYVAFDDSGEMISTLRLAPYEAYFDESVVSVTGIGAVASLPHYRNRGAVRECLRKAFLEMYESECAFTYLFGFSMNYYKKFGYVPICDLNDWEAKIHRIIPCGTQGSYELVEGDIRGCKEVYEAMCVRFNMLAKRKEPDWVDLKNNDYIKRDHYTYLYRNTQGIPLSFFTYSKSVEGTDNVLDCSEVYFYEKEGFGAILDFAIGLKGNFQILKMSFSADLNMSSMLSEQARSAIVRKSHNNGMARVICLQKVLANAAYRGSGRIIIKIEDEMLLYNNGTWDIEFEDGKFKSLVQTNEKPWAEMNVERFTALILGRYDWTDVELIADLKVLQDNENFTKVFYRKKAAIYEHF